MANTRSEVQRIGNGARFLEEQGYRVLRFWNQMC